MYRFQLILTCLMVLLLTILPTTAYSAPEDSAWKDTKTTARTAIWKAINSGKAGSATVAVMEKGQLIYAEGFGMANREKSIPVTKNTIFNIGSISKVYCATAIMLLVDDGKLSLDKPVIYYLPEFTMADEGYKDITVRMLLNHSSGMPGTICANAFGFEYHEEFYKEFLDTLAKSSLKHRPGEMAPYCNDGFTLAEIVVAKISGKSYLQFLNDRVLSPLALHYTGPSVGQLQDQKNLISANYYDEKGQKQPLEILSLLGSGGLSTTAEDLCRFADTFSPKGQQILSKTSLTEMTADQHADSYTKLRHLEMSFGLGWDATELPCYKEKGIHVFGKGGATGNYSSMLITIPDKRISVAVITTGPSAGTMEIAGDILDTFLTEKGLWIKETPMAKRPLTAQPFPPELVTYEGYYSNGNNLLRIKLDPAQNRLLLYITNEGQEVEMASALYNDGYFDAKGTKYYFTTVDDRHYLVEFSAKYKIDTIAAQKIQPVISPITLTAVVDGRQWLRRNAKAYEGLILTAGHVLTSRLFESLPGYVDFSGVKVIQTPSSASSGINAMRDLSDLKLTEKKGTTWAWVTGMEFTPADAAQPLTAGQVTVTLQKEGYNEWLTLREDTILNFQLPPKGRVIVFSPTGRSLYDSAINSGEVFAPTGSFIEMAGTPGDIFKIMH